MDMLKRKLTTFEKCLFVIPVVLLVLPFFFNRKSPESRLNAALLELAGPNASACGNTNDPNASFITISQMHACMRQAYEQRKPFWVQRKRHYIGIHGGEWEVWKGYVSTPQREVFTLGVENKSGFAVPQIKRFRWVNPQVKVIHDTKYLGCDNEDEVKFDFW